MPTPPPSLLFLSLSPVSSHNLHRQGTSVNEPTRIQDNLGDHGIVWHHHGHRAEEGLKVVREFRSAGIPGVHSDEHTARGVQFDLRPLEQKSGRTRGDTCKCTVHVYIPQVYTLNYTYMYMYTCTLYIHVHVCKSILFSKTKYNYYCDSHFCYIYCQAPTCIDSIVLYMHLYTLSNTSNSHLQYVYTVLTSLYGHYLLCHHRQHLQVYPIELVETRPRPA